MDKVATQTCCPGAVHAQIEYVNPNGLSIETAKRFETFVKMLS